MINNLLLDSLVHVSRRLRENNDEEVRPGAATVLVDHLLAGRLQRLGVYMKVLARL